MIQPAIIITFTADATQQCTQGSHWVKPHYRRGKEVAGFCRKSRGGSKINQNNQQINQKTPKTTVIKPEVNLKLLENYKSIMINLFGKEKLGGEPLDIELKALGGKKGEYKHPPGVTEKSDYEITYAIAELSDLITSHQPGKQFGADSRFPEGIQDRDYTKKAEQSKVIDIAAKIDPAFMLSEAVSAAEGPPIVTTDGIVLSGNGRTMGLKLTRSDFPNSAEKYREKLKRQAIRYGFKKTDLKDYEFPVLTRIIDIDSSSKEAVDFGIAANAKIGASRSEIREAAAFANNLPDTLMNEIRDADETSMSRILEQKNITDFIRNNIPVKDQQTFINQTTNKITDSGKALIKRIMLINALGKPETLENMSPKQYRTFESMLPVLIDLSQKQKKGKISKDFNISKLIEDSLDFYSVNITGRDYNSYQHYTEQAELFEEKVKPSPEVEAFIKKYEKYENKPTSVKNYVKNLIKNSVAETHFSGGLLGVEPKTFAEIIETSAPLAEKKEVAMFNSVIKINFGAWFDAVLERDEYDEMKFSDETKPEKVIKPCHKTGFCAYGQVVEEFPLKSKNDDKSCEIFGHDCPVFRMAESISEGIQKELFNSVIKINFAGDFDESKHKRDSEGKFSKKGEQISKAGRRVQRRITGGEEMVKNPPGETQTIPDVGGGVAQFIVDKIFRIFSVYNDQKRFHETALSVKTTKKKGSKAQRKIDIAEEKLEASKKAGKYNPGYEKFEFLKAKSTIKIKFDTIAIDLDGTIAEYDKWKGESKFGAVKPGAVDTIKELKEKGHKIIIWTTRGDKELIEKYLDENDIPCDEINENSEQPEGSSNKIIADFYIDDKAIEFISWDKISEKLLTQSTIKIKFQADSGKIWVKEHMRRGKTVEGHWRVRRGGSAQPTTSERKATPIGVGAQKKGEKPKEITSKPVEKSEKVKKVLSQLAGLKKLRIGLTARESAFKAEFDTNASKLAELLPEAKGRFKTWVNKSIEANQKAAEQIESGEISSLKAAQVQGIMINFVNILKANKQFKEKQDIIKNDEKEQ